MRRSSDMLFCAMERHMELWAARLGLAGAHARASNRGDDEMDWQPADYGCPARRGPSASRIPCALLSLVAS